MTDYLTVYEKANIMQRRVTFLPGSPDKRFVLNMAGIVGEYTPKRIDHIQRLWHKYRRQIPEHRKDNCGVCMGLVIYTPRDTECDSETAEKLRKWTGGSPAQSERKEKTQQ